MKRGKPQVGRWNYRATGVVIVVFLLIALVGFYLIQTILLNNAQELGNDLAGRYAEVELQQVHGAEPLLELGIKAMEKQVETETPQQERVQWAQLFFDQLMEVAGGEIIPCAVIQGELVTAQGVTEFSQEDVTQAKWYLQAVGSSEKTVVTGNYEYPENGATIMIAGKSSNSQDVMAFKVKLEDISAEQEYALPQGSSYYLCSADGELLYAKTQVQADPEMVKEHIRSIFYQIQAGELEGAQEYIYDLMQEKRAVYYQTAENGSVSIITIPYSALLGDLRQIFNATMVICGGFLLFLVFMSLREYRMQKRMDLVNETVAALGNFYYSIYRVNWAQGTYEIIKGSEYVSQRLPAKGKYHQLLEVVSQIIDADTFDQFKTSFSLENMRYLVEQNISDFGGDFRRLFGDEYRWVNVRLLFDANLSQDEAILCFRLVDQEKSRQLQQVQVLENALDQIKESESAKEQFFSQMSHDMRTPLNVIIGTVQLAQRKPLDLPTAQDSLKKIHVAATQLLELINDILEMARIEKTDLHLKNAPCDLRETVEQCLSGFQSQAELQHKNLQVTFDLAHPRVYVDELRLQQVLNNLVSNALKFTQEGDSIQVEVSQPPRQDEGICQVVVRDTGIGMSEEFLPQLFQPYARESRFGTQTVLGTGLGMAIVQTIVTRMGGQIQVESKLGQGTEFTLTIPMEPVREELSQTEEKAASKEPTEILRGKKVLLAEDYEMNLEIATELLKLCGAQVTQARDGKQAVEAFLASEPGWFDVVLMDMNMPVMDGCAAATAIRESGREDSESVPILAVTANAFAEDIAATAKAGMNAHIPKPIDLVQLAEALQKLIH